MEMALEKAVESGQLVVVVGWKASNHSSSTKRLEKLGRVRFLEISTTGNVRGAIPDGALVVITRFVSHRGYQAAINAFRLGVFKKALASAFKYILDQKIEAKGESSSIVSAPEPEISTSDNPEYSSMTTGTEGGGGSATPKKSDDLSVALALLSEEFEKAGGSISSKALGKFLESAGPIFCPEDQSMFLRKRGYIKTDGQNHNRYYPGPALVTNCTSPKVAQVTGDVARQLGALAEMVLRKSDLEKRLAELERETAEVLEDLKKVSEAERKIEQIRSLLDLTP